MKQWHTTIRRWIADAYRRHEYGVLGVVLLLFSGLALGNITRWSIWFDEAFSAYLMRFNLAELTRFTALDVHPPLYYWLLKGWTTLFGTSELAFRSMSVVFALVALIGGYMLVRQLFNRHAALWAISIAALSPLLLRYADEARMYTLVAAIVLWASYLLVRLQARSSRWGWALYGILLAAGMYTHYYAAFAWLSHWAWRWFERRQGRIAKFWTRSWIAAHAGAVALFVPWLWPLIEQTKAVQQGFWIPPLSAYTPIDYLSHATMYLQYGAVKGWWAVLFWLLVVLLAMVIWRGRRALARRHQSGYALLVCLAVVPPLCMALVSLPPLASTFMDRYVLPSILALSMLIGVSLYVLRSRQPRLVGLATIVVISCLLVGSWQVYYYGNYNKNSNFSIRVRESVDLVHQYGRDGQPIIASSPWSYYEASFYDSRQHRVYFMDESTRYEFGSLAMLRDSSRGKITNLDNFTKRHRYVWYLETRVDKPANPPRATWKALREESVYDPINNNRVYYVTLYDTQPSAE